MLKSIQKLAVAATLVILSFAPAAAAEASSSTMVVKGEVDTFTFDFPCISSSDNPYDVTTTSPNTVMHLTTQTMPDGTTQAHFNFTQEGSYTAASESSGPTLSGGFSDHFSGYAVNPVFDASGNVISADRYVYTRALTIRNADGGIVAHTTEHISTTDFTTSTPDTFLHLVCGE